ncbi:hypothetical protein CYK37_16250 [Mesorhizobium loti]|nr:hypothetical protein CYK37_16250 [Mesorhizobium loti]
MSDIAVSPILERFRFSRKRGNAPTLCFYAIPDAKPLHTFAGIALKGETYCRLHLWRKKCGLG